MGADGGTPATCYTVPVTPTCMNTSPAPTSSTAINAFIQGAAIPLRCGASPQQWDIRALVELFADNRMFAMGEVHGSNEIGITSSHILDGLVNAGVINVVGVELPMDLQDTFAAWVDQGDPFGDQIIESFALNMFGRILPEHVKVLRAAGHDVTIALLDSPYGSDVPTARIRALGASLTQNRAAVLDALPTPFSMWEQATQQDFDNAQTYLNGIEANLQAICAELDAVQCDELHAMARAIWVAAGLGLVDQDAWFAMREEVIYFNMQDFMRAQTDRMYLHMGAFHTNRYSESAGSRMARENPATLGRFFSVGPAYGTGSAIYYSGVQQLPRSPDGVAPALDAIGADPVFISSILPNAECTDTPIATMVEDVSLAPAAETLDGYVHIRRLTPETQPTSATVLRFASPWVRSMHSRLQRIHQVEQNVLSGRLAKQRR